MLCQNRQTTEPRSEVAASQQATQLRCRAKPTPSAEHQRAQAAGVVAAAVCAIVPRL